MSATYGYQTENSITNYPFKDSSVLISRIYPNGLMPNNVVIDFQLTTSLTYIRYMCLQNLSFDYTDESHKKIYLRIHLFNASKEMVDSETDNIIHIIDIGDGLSFTPFTTFYFTNVANTIAFKIVFGNGMLDIINHLSTKVITVFEFDTYLNSSTPQAEINNECLIVQNSIVTGIDFYNMPSEDINEAQLVYSSNTSEFNITAGTNIGLTELDDGIELFVKSGAGAGQYDPCNDSITGIKTINGISSNSINQNFVFTTDNCYTTENSPALTRFKHHCNPKCTETDISSFVHYWNRLKDAMKQLSVIASTDVASVQQTLINIMNDYKAKFDLLLQNKAPYIEIQHVKSTAGSKTYVSFAVGIYDPNRQDMLLNFIVKPEAGVTWQYTPNTAFLKESNNMYVLPFSTSEDTSWKFIDRAVNCRGSVVIEYVLLTEDDITNKTVGVQLSESSTITRPATSFNLHTLSPDKLYFTVKSKRVWNESISKYTYNFSIELMKADLDIDNPTVPTNLTVLLPAGLSLIPGSVNLIKNNGYSAPVALNDTLSYSNLSINYSQRATVLFNAYFIPSGGNDFSANFNMTVNASTDTESFAKTFNFK